MIAEYSQVKPEDRAVDTVIRTETRTNDYGRKITWTLSHRSSGFVPAGSCMRYQENPVYRVTTLDASSGTTHGQAFLTLAEAEKYLAERGTL